MQLMDLDDGALAQVVISAIELSPLHAVNVGLVNRRLLQVMLGQKPKIERMRKNARSLMGLDDDVLKHIMIQAVEVDPWHGQNLALVNRRLSRITPWRSPRLNRAIDVRGGMTSDIKCRVVGRYRVRTDDILLVKHYASAELMREVHDDTIWEVSFASMLQLSFENRVFNRVSV